MLHWLFSFSILLFICLVSLITVNKSLLQLVLLSEIILVLVLTICCIVGSLYNVYILITFSLLLLIFGGLELSLNLLLLSINC